MREFLRGVLVALFVPLLALPFSCWGFLEPEPPLDNGNAYEYVYHN